ncbi:MAG: MFS transporter [Acidimicrobiia bacterium]
MTDATRRRLVLASMSVVSALIWLPTSAIPIALPAIRDDLGSSLTELEWMINAYTLTVAALLVLMGRTGDLFGRKRLFITGGVIFSLGALTAASAQNTALLIAGVAIIGAGAAMAGPASLALVADAFPPARQGWAIGVWGAASGIGSAIGPLVGGALVDGLDWRAVFWVNVPLVLAALVAAAVACPESRVAGDSERRLDTPGASTFGAGLTALVLALVQGGTWGWGSVGVLALFAAAAVLLVSFVVIDVRVATPLIPLREFASRPFVISVTVLIIGNAVFATILFALPLYLQNSLHRSAIATGLILLPATATLMLLSPVSGVLTDRFGPRLPMVTGVLVSALGTFVLSWMEPGSNTAQLVPGLLLIGVGFGLQITPVNVAAVQAVQALRRATASGVLLTMGMVGATLGIAAFGAVFGAITRADLPNELDKVGVAVGDGDVETLDEVVVGSQNSEEVLAEYDPDDAAGIDKAVDRTAVNALSDVLVIEAMLQLALAGVAACLPRRSAIVPAAAPTGAVSA